MAISKNPLLKNASGKIGKSIVLKNYSYGTVISAYPDMSKVKPSKKQRQAKNRFAEAVQYAKSILANPKKKAALKAKLPRGKSVYHAAIKKYLKG